MKKRVLIISALLLVIILFSAFFLYRSAKRSADIQKAQKFYDLGLKYEKNGDFGNALKNFKLAEKIAPPGTSLNEKARKKLNEVKKKIETVASGGNEGKDENSGGVIAPGGASDTGGEGSTGGNTGKGDSGGNSGDTYFPEIPGFLGGSVLKGENTTYRVYDYVQGDNLKTLLITVYKFESEKEASGFAERVSFELYKDETKAVDFEDVKDAFYGENRKRNKSTIVWSKGKTVVEIILTALNAPVANYYKFLVDVAEKVNH